MYGLYNDYSDFGEGNMMSWFGGGITMILFWLAVIFFIVWLIRETKNRHTYKLQSKPALDTLKER